MTEAHTDEWEPERPGRTPMDYFRERPGRIFAWLGTILFVGGWASAIWLFVDPLSLGSGVGVDEPLRYRVQNLVSVGSGVTLAAGVLWGIAVYLWVNVLPDAPDSPADAGEG